MNRKLIAIAVAAFAAIFLFGVPFPLIVATAALIGWLGFGQAAQGVQGGGPGGGEGQGDGGGPGGEAEG